LLDRLGLIQALEYFSSLLGARGSVEALPCFFHGRHHDRLEDLPELADDALALSMFLSSVST
jgi:hypothetical protein